MIVYVHDLVHVYMAINNILFLKNVLETKSVIICWVVVRFGFFLTVNIIFIFTVPPVV